MAKLVVDKEKCIGCGTCTALVPKVFNMNSAGKAEVIDQDADTKENIQSTIEACPVQAISYKD